MTSTLPLEIASSLRLILVGDTGVGKSKSSALFLSSVPGQVSQDNGLSSPDISALSVQDKEQDDDGENEDQDASKKTSGQTTNGHVNGDEVNNEFLSKDSVSTLAVPGWLLVGVDDKTADGSAGTQLVPAENIVLHDFVGYGQTLDARQTIDRVDAFLTEQYVATLDLFGPAVTPLSTFARPGPPSSEEPQTQPFLEQLLVDSPMAHSLPDACLYFVLYDLKPVDIIFMKRIMHHVNLIPIIAKADTLSINQLWKAKARVLKQLEDNDIEFFRFGFTMEDLKDMAAERQPGGPPFALSTSQLEAQNTSPAAENLTELALAINEGKFSNAHSDLSLLQTLLLGAKNRMLHQASVKKFLNRWKTDLGLPLEGPVQDPPASSAEELPQEVEEQQEEQQQQPQPSDATQPQEEDEKEQEDEEEEQLEKKNEEEHQEHQVQEEASVQQQQQQLPAALQQQVYQPQSSYTQYMSQSQSNLLAPKVAAVQDDEVAQVIKLNRAQSVIRSASPAARIYTQGSIIPAVPSSLNTSSTPVSPNSTPPPSSS
ncbi:Neuronal-specific septin-3 [Mortierella alpina]|nr:Neuronal-specific septin-3 [Mortierella alpina]